MSIFTRKSIQLAVVYSVPVHVLKFLSLHTFCKTKENLCRKPPLARKGYKICAMKTKTKDGRKAAAEYYRPVTSTNMWYTPKSIILYDVHRTVYFPVSISFFMSPVYISSFSTLIGFFSPCITCFIAVKVSPGKRSFPCFRHFVQSTIFTKWGQ